MPYWVSTVTHGRISGKKWQAAAHPIESAVKHATPGSEGIILPSERGRPKESRNKERWKSKLADYLEHKKTFGREPSNSADDAVERSIAVWRNNQRTKYRAGKISNEQKDLLVRVGFVFNMKRGRPKRTHISPMETKTHEVMWETNFQDFLTFIAEHGRLPSINSIDSRERQLHSWRWIQAAKLKEGKLSENRLAKLNEALFFNLFDACKIPPMENKNKWDAMFTAWVEFKNEHGREPSQKAKNPDEKRLGSWCNIQRCRSNHNTLRPERKTVLFAAGFDFGEGGMWNKKWDKKFAEYMEFRAKQEREPEQKSRDRHERQLARWCHTQRALDRNGRLLTERKTLLEKEGILEHI
jgi:hypothetical protein